MVDSAIYQILAAAADVTAIVGTNIYTSIAAQQGVSEYIVINQIDAVPEDTKDGYSKLDTCRVQVDCMHTSKDNANTLAAKVRTALDRYRGSIGSFTIDKIVFDDARTDYDIDRQIFRVIQDFFVRLKRNAS